MVLTSKQKVIKDQFEKWLKGELLKTWVEQGHNMNGKVVQEMDLVVEQTFDKISFLLYSLPYGVYIEAGVPASSIPFSGTGGDGGGKSAYIQGLISYAMKRMALDEKQAKSAAFAIAYTHMRRGMPSPASSRYSSTGSRIEWISHTMERNEVYIQEWMSRFVFELVSTRFENLILKYSKEFKSTA